MVVMPNCPEPGAILGCVGLGLREVEDQWIAGVEADDLSRLRLHFDRRLEMAVVGHRAYQLPGVQSAEADRGQRTDRRGCEDDNGQGRMESP